jgi:hypothetical protein
MTLEEDGPCRKLTFAEQQLEVQELVLLGMLRALKETGKQKPATWPDSKNPFARLKGDDIQPPRKFRQTAGPLAASQKRPAGGPRKLAIS